MSESRRLLTTDPRDVDATMQAVRLQLYRENIGGALDLVEAAHAAHPDSRYAPSRWPASVRGWLLVQISYIVRARRAE